MKTVSNPANYYASTNAIPDCVEAAILNLSKRQIFYLVRDLMYAIRDERFNIQRSECVALKEEIHQWLEAQDVDTFKALNKWIACELI